ncbi:MAG: fibrobacter succinogenes major paralogous domain-containing protein [Chitinispirillaceae bacterium]|nr:fibrobacter succinogenes major paralogous domain-containing protein [Chitinispirillaceae bacterium]
MKTDKIVLITLAAITGILHTACDQPVTADKDEPVEVDSTVTDADGNVYHTVVIGTQIWTVENLRTTRYNDGTPIPQVSDSAAWSSLNTPGYCYYNNTTDNDSIEKNGALYNWLTVETGKLAPEGWRVPTLNDWNILEIYLIDHDYSWNPAYSGEIAKSLAAQTDWKSTQTQGTPGNDMATNNSSGFSAYPSGGRTPDGVFWSMGTNSIWWTADERTDTTADYRMLYNTEKRLHGGSSIKTVAGSIRLVCEKTVSIPVDTPDTGSTMTDSTMTDIDGNTYHLVKLGTQIWTVENLRTTRLNDGTPISLNMNAKTWIDSGTPQYCYVDTTNKASIRKYGAFYNGYTVDTRKLAPEGWHVPTLEEWFTLLNYLALNGYNWDGTTTENKVAKAMAATTDWNTDITEGALGCDLSKNNRSGFTALPTGFLDRNIGINYDREYATYWWCFDGTESYAADFCALKSNWEYCGFDYKNKNNGLVVRLVKD